ncbi:hypothetical protein ACFOUV_03660 [Oceanobacillus longus]|uniref:Negative regulator of sigma-X activity n=1 Tax=Oceanobacillus longus TaxID=930120 RepID=A0ABV8GSP1_9BACI
MRQIDKEQQEIIDRLQEMPEIKDDTEKNVLYHRISSSLTDPSPTKKRQKRQKLIPVLATMMAVTFILIIPVMLNNDNQVYQNSEQFSDVEIATNIEKSEDSRRMESSDEDQVEMGSEESVVQNSELMDELKVPNDDSLESYVIQESNEPMKIVYGALSDLQQQYIIPISFIVSGNANLDEYYNELKFYINNEEWATNEYMLKNASIVLNESEVLIELGDKFSIGEGSTNAYLFEKMLSAMFTPYGINKAVFQSDTNGVELGPYGVIEELLLNKEENLIYKRYNNQFLVPIPNLNLSIQDALTEMKIEQKEFNIDRTIPEEVQFTVDSSKNLLKLTLDDGSVSQDEQQVMTMIEAILMTAKSYGYQSVQFNNFPFDQIGRYNISAPIPVPIAANPIDIRN